MMTQNLVAVFIKVSKDCKLAQLAAVQELGVGVLSSISHVSGSHPFDPTHYISLNVSHYGEESTENREDWPTISKFLTSLLLEPNVLTVWYPEKEGQNTTEMTLDRLSALNKQYVAENARHPAIKVSLRLPSGFFANFEYSDDTTTLCLNNPIKLMQLGFESTDTLILTNTLSLPNYPQKALDNPMFKHLLGARFSLFYLLAKHATFLSSDNNKVGVEVTTYNGNYLAYLKETGYVCISNIYKQLEGIDLYDALCQYGINIDLERIGGRAEVVCDALETLARGRENLSEWAYVLSNKGVVLKGGTGLWLHRYLAADFISYNFPALALTKLAF